MTSIFLTALDQFSKRFRTFSRGPSLDGTHFEGGLAHGGVSGEAAGPLPPAAPSHHQGPLAGLGAESWHP